MSLRRLDASIVFGHELVEPFGDEPLVLGKGESLCACRRAAVELPVPLPVFAGVSIEFLCGFSHLGLCQAIITGELLGLCRGGTEGASTRDRVAPSCGCH